jgi:cell wall-associated NlpC family hydrolase
MKLTLTAMAASIALISGSTTLAAGELTTAKQQTISFEELVKPQRNAIRMQQIVEQIKDRAGRTPYVFSGSSTRGWDCSGLTRWAYKQIGVIIPHSANAQAHIGVRVSRPQVGDIVVMAWNGRTDFYHAGLYVGNNKVVNANRYFGTTRIESIKNFKNSQIRYVRVIPMAEPRQLP